MKSILLIALCWLSTWITAQPNWTVVTYTNSTTAYGIVTINGEPAVTGDWVGAFVGEECRAAQEVIINEGTAYCNLQIQGETVETVSFKIWDASTGKDLLSDLTVQSSPGNTIGYPDYLQIAAIAATLDVSPGNQDVSASSGTTDFTVTTNSNWTASSDAAWCTVPASGSGSGTLTATYDENTSTTTPRSATITVTVDGVTPVEVTVTQAKKACTLDVGPANQDVSYLAGTIPFTLTTECDWTASSDAAWCTVPVSGSGSGTLTASYDENTSTTTPRSATITVTVDGVTPVEVTVTQAKKACTLEVSPAHQDISYSASTLPFAVTTECDWTASSDVDWVTVTASGSGNEILYTYFEENPSTTTSRTATITVTVDGVTPVDVAVTQAKNDAVCEPGWTLVTYTNSTTAYCHVTIDDAPASEGDKIGAFVGSECRGIGEVVLNSGEAYATVIIQGEAVEEVIFKIWDQSECSEINAVGTFTTSPGGIIGSPPDYLQIGTTEPAVPMTYVPDNNFEQALIDLGYDSGALNDSVPTANISGVIELDVGGKSISDLTGIEGFAALKTFYCHVNQLTSLSFNQNIYLEELHCIGNQLTSIDISQNKALKTLFCYENQLTSLDVSQNTLLQHLACFENQITSLDVTQCSELVRLDCSENKLENLSVGTNASLEELVCNINQLQSLDVSQCSNLKYLKCDNNQLTFDSLEPAIAISTFVYSPQDSVGTKETTTKTEGEDYSYNLSVGGSANQYQWYRDDVALPTQRTATLNLTNLTLADAGVYTCEVTNTIVTGLTLYSREISLTVNSIAPLVTDSLALVALYNSTDGPNWNVKWDLNTRVSTWSGITVTDNRVTDIIVNDNNLTGTLPGEMADLSELQTLHLYNNNLSGSLQAISNLPKLDYLVCDNNQFSGDLSQFANLTNMYWLSFENNQLTGTIEPLMGLTKLEGLIFNGNQLSGSIPSSISNLTELRYLWLNQNQISGSIPTAIGQLTKLERLYLNENILDGQIPAEIGQIDSLSYLYLYSNQLTGNIPIEIGNLQTLTRLYVHDNSLSGEIPISIGNLSNLIYLGLYQNNLTGNIPSEIGNLTNLYYLGLFENNLSGELPGSIGNLSNLGIITVRDNQFSGEIPSNIGNLTALTALMIANNKYQHSNIEPVFGWSNYANLTNFVYAPQDSIGTNKHLQIGEGENISISIDNYVASNNDNYQWFKDGTEISGANGIEYNVVSATLEDQGIYTCVVSNGVTSDLNLYSRKISLTVNSVAPIVTDSLALVALYNATDGPNWVNNTNWLSDEPVSSWYGVTVEYERVTRISFNNNNLTGTLPPEIGDLTKLEWLVAHSEHLSGAIPTELEKLVNLEVLDLAYNQFDGSLPSGMGNMIKLVNIELSSSGITGTIPISIGNCINLEWIRMPNNQITGTLSSEIGNLQKLVMLDISANQLNGTIPIEIGNLSELQYLELGGNQLSGEIPNEICNLSSLLQLHLHYNQLSGSIPESLNQLTGLESIALGGNQLTGTIPVNIASMVNLQSILLEGNQLTGEVPSGIGNLTQLYQLNLIGNQLTGNIPLEFQNLTSLEYLGISSNFFSDLPDLSALPQLRMLDCENNELTFEDIEPNITIPSFNYHGQANIGELVETTVLEGSSYSYQLITGGTANQYQWLKDGDILPSQRSATLNLTNLTTDNAGFYTCMVTNTIAVDLTLFSKEITLTVEECQIAVSPVLTDLSYPNQRRTIEVNSNSDWSISESMDWINITKTSGTGIDTFAIAVDENTGEARTGTVTVNGCDSTITITVNQAAWICELDVETTSLDYPQGGDAKSIAITSNSDWSASADVHWITVTPSNSSEDGLLTIEVEENTGDIRSGTVTVSGCNVSKTIAVTQAAWVCELSVSPTQLSYSKGAGTKTVDVTSNSDWTVTDDSDWISISKSGDTGNESFSVTVEENTGATRSGTVTVSGCETEKTITVNQADGVSLSSEADILSFSIDGQINATIGESDIQVIMPFKTNLANLVPAIQISAAASISPNAGIQTDFTNPVQYVVTAEDNVTTKNWMVYVENAPLVYSKDSVVVNGLWNMYRELPNFGTIDSLLTVSKGHVTRLNLSNKGLWGGVPRILADLDSLRWLDLSHNNLSGSLPDIFGDINGEVKTALVENKLELDYLNISYNRFVFKDLEPEWDKLKQIPEFIFEPQANLFDDMDTTINLNSSISFNLGSYSPGNYDQFQWYKDSVEIQGETNLGLSLENVAYGDSGIYHCKITNTLVSDLTLLSGKFKLSVDNLTSVDVSQLYKLRLYPNPTQGKVTIEFNQLKTSEITVCVFGIDGSRIFQKTYLPSENLSFELSDEVSGMYFVKIITDDGEVVKKLILKKN